MSVKEEIMGILLEEFGLSNVQRCENVSEKLANLFLDKLAQRISSLKNFIKSVK